MASDSTKSKGGTISSDLAKFAPAQYGLAKADKAQINAQLDNANSVGAADWSAADNYSNELSSLADAFMEQYANGSDIANAQNAQAAANFARNASRQRTSFADIQNQGEQLVQGSLQNTAQGTQANLQQGQQAQQTVQAAKAQEYAQNLQRSFANMNIARTKKQILDQASLADRSGIEAAQQLKNSVANQKQAIDIGIQQQDWQNTLNAIKLIGGVAEGGLAVGAGLSKSSASAPTSTLGSNAVTAPGSNDSSGYAMPVNVYTGSSNGSR